MAAPKKQYGLIIPKSKQQAVKKPAAFASKSVFGNNNSSDEEDVGMAKASINRSLAQVSSKKASNKSAQIVMSRALEQDPTVYQYDEVYDKMTNDRHCVAEQKKTKDRKPKYVHQLLKNAATRKLEDERRLERQAHRDREKEGDEFGDKEAYVTPSFLKKQAELKAAEEAARRKEAEEAANDVTKKDNLNDFYRNLLSRKTSAGNDWSQKPEEEKEKERKPPTAGVEMKKPTSATAPPSSRGESSDGVATRKTASSVKREVDAVSPLEDGDDEDENVSDGGSDSDSSAAEPEEIEAAMEAVKTKADREAEELLARKRALEVARQKRAAEEQNAADRAAKLDRRNDETSIMSARDRYLARKREQAAKGATGSAQ